jgi:phage tail sheath protein FI
MGIKPNFLLIPGYSGVPTIATKMRETAEILQCKAIIDIVATNVQEALTKRNTVYTYSDTRVVLCFPNVMTFNEDEQKEVETPLSQLWVNGIIETHTNQGYWYSPSNQEIKSAIQTKVLIKSSLTDAGSDTNLLNAQGIVTVYRDRHSGFRLWGNWTSAYPSESGHAAQIAPSIVRDVLESTIKRESIKFIDKNIDYPTLDYIVQSVQAFLYELKGKGAIIDGTIGYSLDKNPLTQVSKGQFVFEYSYCEVPTLDRITYESYQDINYLKNLFQN